MRRIREPTVLSRTTCKGITWQIELHYYGNDNVYFYEEKHK